MQAYEKLGLFYLGRRYDEAAGAVTPEPLLYDAADLTTHGVIVGMTGSGKTGLGIGLIEEAAMDRVPVIAVDPKGDLGNLLLTFPDLAPGDFEPWVDPAAAERKGVSVPEYAAKQAELWRRGLADWDQDGARIGRLREQVELGLYTPGSTAGQPLSVLKSFKPPPAALRAEPDLYQDRLQATAGSILTLLGESADADSPAAVLLSRILDHAWAAERALDLPGLFAAIQRPPFENVGLMPTDDFMPAKERQKLALRLNSLLAAPGFSAWLEGAPLQADRLLYNDAGKPRLSVVSIAHLDDSERLFFLSLLLAEIIAWMRSQPGTGSLRALLYIDEIFGFMPPTANPPTKRLLLTLLKQARAFGLGVVLSTQNPVDLDYKGLSNAGTWFIGRLQTERDRDRLLDGLASASGAGPDRSALNELIPGLGKRVFLLHNVHESSPALFHTRWAMSYLAGPLSRAQIKRLTAEQTPAPEAAAADAATTAPTPKPAPPAPETTGAAAPPAVAAGIDQFFLPVVRSPEDGDELLYRPLLLAAADVGYHSARYKVDDDRRFAVMLEVEDGPRPVDWSAAGELTLPIEDLEPGPLEGAGFQPLAALMNKKGTYSKATTLFKRWLRNDQPLALFKSPTLKTWSRPGESERDFRIRLQTVAAEERDRATAALRKRYAGKLTTLNNRLLRAEQAIAREAEQARRSKFDSAISMGSALLSAFLGRRGISATSASKVSTAAKGMGRIAKEQADVARAEQTAAAVRAEIVELEQALEREIAGLAASFDPLTETLEPIHLRPKSTDIHIHFVALGWAPYLRRAQGPLVPAWE
jgi:hypothetical protein